jgi:hypothetical protein
MLSDKVYKNDRQLLIGDCLINNYRSPEDLSLLIKA